MAYSNSNEEIPIKVLYIRPLSASGEEIAFVDKKKRFIDMVESIDALDHESQKVVYEALDERYFYCRIEKVYKTSTCFGTRFWDVETNRGRRMFALCNPHKDIVYVTEDKLFIKDTLGNRYTVDSIVALDEFSKRQIEKVV